MNYIEKEIYEGFQTYMDSAESEITASSIKSKELKENIYEKYRRAFFLMQIDKLHNDNREADIHKVVLPLTRMCLKKGLYDFYQMRTIKAEKLERDNSYINIMELFYIRKKIEEKENFKIPENVIFILFFYLFFV